METKCNKMVCVYVCVCICTCVCADKIIPIFVDVLQHVIVVIFLSSFPTPPPPPPTALSTYLPLGGVQTCSNCRKQILSANTLKQASWGAGGIYSY